MPPLFETSAPTVIPTRPAPGKRPPKPPGAPGLLGALAATKPKPLGPAPPIVTAHGIPSIAEFNRRLDEAVGAFRQIWGYEPTPGLAFDLTKIDLDGPGYRAFLGGARTPRQASQSAALQKVLALGPPGLGEVTQAAQDYADLQKALERFVGYEAGPARFPRKIIGRFGVGEPAFLGYGPEQVGVGLEGISLFGKQGGQFFKQLPFGAWETIRGGLADVRAFNMAVDEHLIPGEHQIAKPYTDPATGQPLKPSFVPRNTAEAFKQFGLAVKEHALHPAENPFNLTMDILMIGAVGGAAALRVGAAGSMLRAGDVPAAAGALLRRPVPKSYVLGTPEMNVTVPMFENVGLRLATAGIARARNAKLIDHLNPDLEFTSPWLTGELTKGILARYVSPEAKLRRATQQETAFWFKVSTTEATLLEHGTRTVALKRKVLGEALRSADAAGAWKAISRRQRAAVDELIWLAHIAVDDPAFVMRAANERAIAAAELVIEEAKAAIALGGKTPKAIREQTNLIEEATRKIAGHKAELGRIADAEALMTRAPKSVQVILDRAFEASRKQERLKAELFGWDEDFLTRAMLEESLQIQGLPVGATAADVRLLADRLRLSPDKVMVTTRGRVLVRSDTTSEWQLMDLKPGQEAYVARYLKQSGRVAAAEKRYGKAKEAFEAAVLPAVKDIVYVPGKREMTMAEVKARAAIVSKQATEMWDYMYVSIREALYPGELAPTRKSWEESKAAQIRRDIEIMDEGTSPVVGGIGTHPTTDLDYKRFFSSGTRNPLKKGETWRGRALAYAAELEAKAKKKEGERATSGEAASLEQARDNRYGSKRKKLGRLTVTEKVNKEVAKRIRDVLDYEGDHPKILAARDLLREDARLGEILNYESVAAGARFMGEEVPPRPLMPTVEAKRVAVETGETIWQPVRGAAYGKETVVKRRGGRLSDERDALERLDKAMAARLEAEPGTPLPEMPTARTLFGVPLTVPPFYVPSLSSIFNEPSGMISPTRGRGRTGLGPPAVLARWRHRRTGAAFESGQRRIDTSDLLVEENRRVTKLALQVEQHDAIWSVAKEAPTGIPRERLGVIRDVSGLTPQQRNALYLIQRDKVLHGEAKHLTDSMYDDVMKNLYPSLEEAAAEVAAAKRAGAEPPRFRYVDKFVIPEMAGVFSPADWQAFSRILAVPMTIPNEIGRIAYLFAKLGYAMNFLGNATLATIRQGPLAFENLGRAMASERIYSPYLAQVIRDAAGISKTISFETERNLLTALSRGMGHTWSKLTDNKWREAAVIYELRRSGVLHDVGIDALEFERRLKAGDPEMRAILNEARVRGGKHMVRFDNLAWPEKAVLSHLFFVYAWISRSSMYSLHYLAEHPIQATWFSYQGTDYEKELDRLIGKTSEWISRYGNWLPINNTFMQNVIQFNVPGSILEIAYPLASLFGNVAYADLADSLGPAMKILIDTFQPPGRFEGGSFVEAVKEAVKSTPFGAVEERKGRSEEVADLPPVPVVMGEGQGALDILDAAVRRESAATGLFSFEADTWWQTWGVGLFGTGVPRDPNELALAAKYWRDLREKDPVAYVEHQRVMAQAMVTRQGKYLGMAVPAAVRQGVDLVAKIETAKEVELEASGMEGSLGARTNFELTLQVLVDEKYLTSAEQKTYLAQAEKLAGRQLDYLRVKILYDSGLDDLRDWIHTQKYVAWVASDDFARAVKEMAAAGVGYFGPAATAPEEARKEYAKKTLAYQEAYDRIRAPLSDERPISKAEQIAIFDGLRDYADAHDRPVTVKGVQFPSAQRINWQRRSPGSRLSAVRRWARQPWEWRTGFEKEVLGVKREPSVQAGWTIYSQAVKVFLDRHPEKEYATTEEKRAIARAVGRDYKGFLVDFEFSQRLPFEQFQAMSVYQRSQNRDEWDDVLETVRTYVPGLVPGNKTNTRKAWKAAVENAIIPYIRDHMSLDFQAELADYGPGFLEGLLG